MSRKDGNIKAKSEQLHQALSDFLDHQNNLAELLTRERVNTTGCLGQGTKELSKFASSRDFKSIILKFLSHLDKLLSIFDLLTVKKESFSKKAEILLRENNVGGNVKIFQKFIREHKSCKIDKIDGHHWVRTSSKTKLCNCDSLVPLCEGFAKILCDVIKSHCSSCKHKPKCFICVGNASVKRQLDRVCSFPMTERAVETDDEPSPVTKDHLPVGETGSLNGESATEDISRNALSYADFEKEISKKYEDLKNFWETWNANNTAKVNEHVLVYKEHMGETKYKLFGSGEEALWWCYDANNRILLEKEFPVVLIRRVSASPSENTRKKKTGMNPGVGREISPSVMAAIILPNSSSIPQVMEFKIDTGADGGSVGYNPEFIKDFVFSLEVIECDLKPVIFGQIAVADRHYKEIQSFDVDSNPRWNALGLEQTKLFDFFHSQSKKITLLLPPNDVTVRHSGDIRLPGLGHPQEISKSGFAVMHVKMTENEVPLRGLQTVADAAYSPLASYPGSLPVATCESFSPTAPSTTATNGNHPPTVAASSSSAISSDYSYPPTVAATNSSPPAAVTNCLSATTEVSYPPTSTVLTSSPATTGDDYLPFTAVSSSLTTTGDSHQQPTAITDCLPTKIPESYLPITAVTNSPRAATVQSCPATAFANSTPNTTDESCPPIATRTNSLPTTTHESSSLTTVANCLPTATDDEL